MEVAILIYWSKQKIQDTHGNNCSWILSKFWLAASVLCNYEWLSEWMTLWSLIQNYNPNHYLIKTWVVTWSMRIRLKYTVNSKPKLWHCTKERSPQTTIIMTTTTTATDKLWSHILRSTLTKWTNQEGWSVGTSSRVQCKWALQCSDCSVQAVWVHKGCEAEKKMTKSQASKGQSSIDLKWDLK